MKRFVPITVAILLLGVFTEVASAGPLRNLFGRVRGGVHGLFHRGSGAGCR